MCATRGDNLKKNRTLCIAFAFVLTVIALVYPYKSGITVANASDGVVEITKGDLDYGLLDIDGKAVVGIFGYYGNYEKVSIPETVDGYPVGYIESNSFSYAEKLKYVELPAEVICINPGVFDGCYMLEEIVISSENKYYSCVDGVLYNKDQTSLVAFPAGRGGSFTIPKSVASIGDFAFAYCRNITDIKMYNNVEYVGMSAFEGCSSLSSIRLSDNLKTLAYKALYNCASLEEIHLPYSLKNIGKNALAGGIDSDDNLYYHTTKGIYYVKGSYSEQYVKSLHLPKGYTISETRTITDIDSGVVLYDSAGVFPENKKLDLSVSILPLSNYSSRIPVRYVAAEVYQVALLVNGTSQSLSQSVVVEFNNFSKDAIPTATKVFVQRSGNLVEQTRAPQAAFVGTTFSGTDTFIVITNNDFSLKGDIDGDGIHSIHDVRFALCLGADLVSNVTPEQLATADVDGVEGIDTSDAYEILCYAAGIK